MDKKTMQDSWKETSYMVELPEYEGKALEVGDGELRCPYCNRLLFKGHLASGSKIEIKCPRRGCNKVFPVNKL